MAIFVSHFLFIRLSVLYTFSYWGIVHNFDFAVGVVGMIKQLRDKGRLWKAMFWSPERTHLRALAIFFDALRCVRSTDQNMAAYNHLLFRELNIFISKRLAFFGMFVNAKSLELSFLYQVLRSFIPYNICWHYYWSSSQNDKIYHLIFDWGKNP